VRVFPPAARTLRGDRRSDRPETGSIRAKARWEVQITAREFPEAAALGSQLQGILTATLKVGRQSIARRIPVGVIGIITPWNSPLSLGVRRWPRETKLVDRDAIRFLLHCEADGMKLENCPVYVREWMAREKG